MKIITYAYMYPIIIFLFTFILEFFFSSEVNSATYLLTIYTTTPLIIIYIFVYSCLLFYIIRVSQSGLQKAFIILLILGVLSFFLVAFDFFNIIRPISAAAKFPIILYFLINLAIFSIGLSIRKKLIIDKIELL